MSFFEFFKRAQAPKGVAATLIGRDGGVGLFSPTFKRQNVGDPAVVAPNGQHIPNTVFAELLE